MTHNDTTRASKFLSLLLRHKPEVLGITLDHQGWASVADLVERSRTQEVPFSLQLLEQIVRECKKQRFEFNEDCSRIRCRQGHSIDVDLGLHPTVPPDVLYHGTATRFLQNILQEGLTPQGRNHVHLSPDVQTAEQVGVRHGKVVVLRVAAKAMAADGRIFFLTENGVWLTEHVPPSFLTPL